MCLPFFFHHSAIAFTSSQTPKGKSYQFDLHVCWTFKLQNEWQKVMRTQLTGGGRSFPEDLLHLYKYLPWWELRAQYLFIMSSLTLMCMHAPQAQLVSSDWWHFSQVRPYRQCLHMRRSLCRETFWWIPASCWTSIRRGDAVNKEGTCDGQHGVASLFIFKATIWPQLDTIYTVS